MLIDPIGEVAEPSALMGETCADVLSTCHNPSNPGGRQQTRNLLHGSGEEQTMVISSLEEPLSEKEEMEIVDSLTGMAMNEETNVLMAEEDVDGLIDDSEEAMNVSQTQPPNLLLVPRASPDPTWVIDHRGQEVEMEARDVDNISERDGRDTDQDMAAPPGLSLNVALPHSAILSIPTLVFLPDVNEATVIFSPASQESQSVIHPLQDETSNRLPENIALWANSSQKPTTNNRGEEVELMNIDNSSEGDDNSRGQEVELMGVGEEITNEEQFVVGRQPLKEHGEDVPTHSLSSFDSEAIITWNRRCREAEVEDVDKCREAGVEDVDKSCREAGIEGVDKSQSKTQGRNPLVFLPDHDDRQIAVFEMVTNQHLSKGHGAKLANTIGSLSKLIPKQGRDSSNAPLLHPATLVLSKDLEGHFDVRLPSDHGGCKSSNPDHNVHSPPAISVKDLEDDIVMDDCNNSENTNSSSPDEDECQTPPALQRPPLVFLKDVDDDFIIDLPHGSDSEESAESDEQFDQSDAPLIFPNESDRDFILAHDLDYQSTEHINLDGLVGGSDDENGHQKTKQNNIFLDPLMVCAYLHRHLHFLNSSIYLQRQEAHYYDLINCPSV